MRVAGYGLRVAGCGLWSSEVALLNSRFCILVFVLRFSRLPGNFAEVSQKLFGTDGIRGAANVEPLTPGSVVNLGLAAAKILGSSDLSDRPKALLGRDTRASGEFLEAAITAGLSFCRG